MLAVGMFVRRKKMKTNDIFHIDDPHSSKFLKWDLPIGWWSRHYEYPWAYQFLNEGDVVADMGCGYTFRPFKNALAMKAKHVYAFDVKTPEDKNDWPPNITFLKESFLEETSLTPNSLDKVFCISVLEDLAPFGDALIEFKRILKPSGLIVLTFDTPYDTKQPTPFYPGVNWNQFRAEVIGSGLKFCGNIHIDKSKAVVHDQYNLCVYHCLLEYA